MKPRLEALVLCLLANLAIGQVVSTRFEDPIGPSISDVVSKAEPHVTNFLVGMFDFALVAPQSHFLVPQFVTLKGSWETVSPSNIQIEHHRKVHPGEIPEFLSDTSLSQAIYLQEGLSLGEYSGQERQYDRIGYEPYRLIGEPER